MTPRLGRALALVAFVGGFALILFGGGLQWGIYSSGVRLALVLVGGGASVAWLATAVVRPGLRPQSRLTGALAVSLLAFAISGALAWQPRLGLDYLAYAVLLTTTYLLLVRMLSSEYITRQMVALVVVTIIAVVLLYFGVVANLWMAFWRDLGHFAVPPLRPGYAGLWLGNPNALASLLVLLLLTAVAGVGTATRQRQLLVVVMVLLVGVAVLLTGSRGAWLGIALATATGGVVWLASHDHRLRLRGALARSTTRVAIGVAAVVAIVVGLAIAPAIASRLGEQAAETRTSFWAASLRMFADRPFTGLGPGSWVPARIPYSASTDMDYYVPHAHNVPLQVASEFGLVGIVAAVVVVVLVIRLIRAGLTRLDPPGQAFAWAALLGCVYLSGQQLVDAYIHQPAILLALAIPVARLDALVVRNDERTAEGRSNPTRYPRTACAVLLAAVIVAVAVVVPIEASAGQYEQAVAAADRGDWATAASLSAQVVDADPQLAPYLYLRGLSLARNGDLAGAAGAFRASAELDDFPPAWLNLAAIAAKRGDLPLQTYAAERAMRIGAQHPALAVVGAGMDLDLGNLDGARDALTAAFATAPSLASDPRWSLPAWKTTAGAAIEAAQQRLGDTFPGYMLALEHDDMARATEIASTFGGRRAEDAALGAQAWAGDRQSFDTLVQHAVARPLDVELLSMCRRVADIARSRGRQDWSCDEAGWTAYYPVLSFGPYDPEAIMPGPAASAHENWAYRRPSVRELLVPWVPHLMSRIP